MPLPPFEFRVRVESLVLRLPRLQTAVANRPQLPQTEVHIIRGGTQPPLYLNAVSLIEEVDRETARIHTALTALMYFCATRDLPTFPADSRTVARAIRWLYRLDAQYGHAQPRQDPKIRDLVEEGSDFVNLWDSRAASDLGEGVPPWDLRSDAGRPILCPAYPRTGGQTMCGRRLQVLRDQVSAVPVAIRCRGGGHLWLGPASWLNLRHALGSSLSLGLPARPTLKRPDRSSTGRA